MTDVTDVTDRIESFTWQRCEQLVVQAKEAEARFVLGDMALEIESMRVVRKNDALGLEAAGQELGPPGRSTVVVAGFRHRWVTGRSAGELPVPRFSLVRRGRRGAVLRTTGTRGTACGT
ncbi:hypothetical protein ABZ235_36190 [Streptomyces canus]|uniref:hypothetical protein n=1 Tax=Streptomyces canus TaxID=58343 RepID=UPI0033BC7786